MRLFPIVLPFLCLTLIACAATPAVQRTANIKRALPTGVWRNDVAKLDYRFEGTGSLTILSNTGAIKCSAGLGGWEVSARTIPVWMYCDEKDWPIFGVNHEFILAEDGKSFVDTKFGDHAKPIRIDGIFNQLSE